MQADVIGTGDQFVHRDQLHPGLRGSSCVEERVGDEDTAIRRPGLSGEGTADAPEPRDAEGGSASRRIPSRTAGNPLGDRCHTP